jgi:hypothetical protein
MSDRAARLSAELTAQLAPPQIELIQQRVASQSLDGIIDAVLNDRL